MERNLKAGDEVIVVRLTDPAFPNENFGTKSYPKLGWIGTIVNIRDDWHQYIICWKQNGKDNYEKGDLVYQWMVEINASIWDI